MTDIQVHDKRFSIYLTEAVLQKRIKELADAVNKDYSGKKVYFIAILNGSFMFAADFFKYLTIDSEICFIKLVSYKGTKSTGNVTTAIGLEDDLHGKDVIILEDIIDTGKTLHYFLPQLQHQQPRSLKIVALLHKSEMTRYEVPIDYTGFVIPNKFVVGYGLDYDGLGRNYKNIYQLAEEVS
ncbi:hypoxanthine phosphoribosyltransferase [Niabella ginsenosidivorans]|uniref:Hypoxanthine phosphoribosyltransferase n=1 Tax=Niabella ginsenosidivorans TaxID=1176587 RepID=A0A1A9HXL9_9BACT|nr:hypoxanthine phosphoribosyltransferase [Niabella ginsenosidivorans]ANH80127.1 hypoxanthine phosphoribosyltransferase [Niabella ginsenosidivorans]